MRTRKEPRRRRRAWRGRPTRTSLLAASAPTLAARRRAEEEALELEKKRAEDERRQFVEESLRPGNAGREVMRLGTALQELPRGEREELENGLRT